MTTQINRPIPNKEFKILQLHDDFIETVKEHIKNIVSLKNKGKYKEAAVAGLNLAKYRVFYYEQFINLDPPNTSTRRIYQDDYNNALIQLGVARDKCLDLGIWEE